MSRAQYHTVKAVRKASEQKNGYGTVQNYALGLDTWGEPVKLAMPEPVTHEPAVGDKLYGQLTEETSNGRTFAVLTLAQKPQPTTDQRIRAQWSIGQAVQVYLHSDMSHEAYENIIKEAKHFYRMVEEVIEE